MHNQNDALNFPQIILSHRLKISNLIVSQITNECNICEYKDYLHFKTRVMKEN